MPGLNSRLRLRTYDHVFASPSREVGGVFVGTRRPGETPTIQDIIPALEAEGDLTSLTFTHEAWGVIHSVMEKRYPGRAIVGWYHSHPGHGIFLSDHDLFIHQNFFADETSIAFVVDPIRGEEGVFGWQGDRIVQLSAAPTLRPGLSPVREAKPVTEAPPARERGEDRPPPLVALASEGDAYPTSGYVVPAVLGVLIGLLLGLIIT